MFYTPSRKPCRTNKILLVQVEPTCHHNVTNKSTPTHWHILHQADPKPLPPLLYCWLIEENPKTKMLLRRFQRTRDWATFSTLSRMSTNPELVREGLELTEVFSFFWNPMNGRSIGPFPVDTEVMWFRYISQAFVSYFSWRGNPRGNFCLPRNALNRWFPPAFIFSSCIALQESIVTDRTKLIKEEQIKHFRKLAKENYLTDWTVARVLMVFCVFLGLRVG